MALTPSTMLPLGTTAPPFKLPNVDGRMVSLDDFKSAPALLVAFICNHCPFVKHVAAGFAQLARDYQAKGAAVVAINSNDPVGYPADSPEQMVHEVENRGYTFPYLFDETQSVAKAYRRGLHAGFLCLRQRSEARLSRANGRQPAGLGHSGHGQGPASGA